MKKILLFTISILFVFNSFSYKEDTMSIYKIKSVSQIKKLGKLFKVKYIKTIDIHDFSDKNFNYLLRVLKKNVGKFDNFKISSTRLGGKYKKLQKFEIKKLFINTVKSKRGISYPGWITGFKVTSLEFKMSRNDNIKNIDLSSFKNLEILRISGGKISINDLKPITRLRFLEELKIDIGVIYDFDFLLKELRNLKKFSANINKTNLNNLPYHYCLEEISAYEADISLFKNMNKLCFLKRTKIYTQVNILEIKKIINSIDCNPFMAFYRDKLSEHAWIAKKVKPWTIKKPTAEENPK